jgi:hypothetical protein
MARLKVGNPDVSPDLPSHTDGVKSGNSKGNYEAQGGFKADGRVTAEISTGMDPKMHGPIDDRMPNIPPG